MVNTSVVFDSEIDERSLDRTVDKVDQRLQETGEIDIDAATGGMGLDSGPGMGGGMGDMDALGEMNDGIGGLQDSFNDSLPAAIPAAGGIASKALPIAIAGGIGAGLLTQMSAASGRLQATLGMFGTAMDLFFKPFGDFLGSKLRPMADHLIGVAQDFNKIADNEGLSVAVASIANNAITGIGSQIGGSFKDIISGEGDVLDFLIAGGTAVTAAAVLGYIGWPTIGAGAVLGSLGLPTIGASALLSSIGFPSIGAASVVGAISWPLIGAGAITGALSWGSFQAGNLIGAMGWGTVSGGLIAAAIPFGTVTGGLIVGAITWPTISAGMVLKEIAGGGVPDNFATDLGNQFDERFPDISEGIQTVFSDEFSPSVTGGNIVGRIQDEAEGIDDFPRIFRDEIQDMVPGEPPEPEGPTLIEQRAQQPQATQDIEGLDEDIGDAGRVQVTGELAKSTDIENLALKLERMIEVIQGQELVGKVVIGEEQFAEIVQSSQENTQTGRDSLQSP